MFSRHAACMAIALSVAAFGTAARYGGQTMQDLLEESVVTHMREAGDKHPFLK